MDGNPPAGMPPAAADEAVLARRARFPRGLAQPEQGFRFGVDTLLLAAYAASQLPCGAALSGLDIGTGCGAASIALALLPGMERVVLAGIDTQPEMLACARANAEALGLGGRFIPLGADAADHRAPAPVDFVLSNPPFRVHGTGRPSPNSLRDSARFEGPGGFAAFAGCAARNLAPRGRLFLVHLAERLPGLVIELAAAGLAVRRATPVQGRAQADPRLVLLAAERRRPASGGSFALSRPLVLYGADGAVTPDALAFCPHLAANARREGCESSRQTRQQGPEHLQTPIKRGTKRRP